MTHFSVKTKICSGTNALDNLDRFSGKKVWIACDQLLVNSPACQRLTERLEPENEICLCSDISPVADIKSLVAGIGEVTKFQPQILIGFGSGAAINTAKAVNFFISHNQKLRPENLIAIPTTGSGSEVSSAIIISDESNGEKYPLFNQEIFPDVAILDPELTVTMPEDITAMAGMDALTHAIEAYVSVNANDFSDALAEKATRLIFQYLPAAITNGSCQITRSKMQNAHAMAGMAFEQAGLGLNHAVSHQVSRQFNVPHGLANAMLLPHVIRLNAKDIRARKRYARLAKFSQLCSKGINDHAAVNQLIFQIKKLQREIRIKGTLRTAGIAHRQLREKLPEMVSAAQADSTITTNPYRASENEIRKIIETLL